MTNPNGVRPDQPLLASLLDRLLGDEQDVEAESPGSAARHLTDLQNGLRRDIEALLNTHQFCKPLPRELPELAQSLLDYGMPHFLGLSAASAPAREQLRASVEASLHRFEPRMRQVTVTLLENTENHDRTLRFRIDALLLVDPEPEPVSFDSVLEAANRRFSVTTVVL